MELTTLDKITASVTTTQTETSQHVCDAILEEVQESGVLADTDPDSLGVYVVSPNAGAQASVVFWKQALNQGPGLMSPLHFPWTLANAPAAYIARKLGAHGPNVTFIGESSSAAFLHAFTDIKAGRCRQGLILLVRFGDSAGAGTDFEYVVV